MPAQQKAGAVRPNYNLSMTEIEIIKALNEFVPFSNDDSTNDNKTFLSDLMYEWKKLQDKKKVIPAIFQLMEKYPHVDFGSPGPLVHALESIGIKYYDGELQQSLLRRPTPLTIWMYNRIINSETNDRLIKGHIERLKLFSRHPFADEETKKIAQQFLEHQERRS